MGRRFLITGCGRSGTKYTARLLSAAGVPCGHEVACGPTGFVGFGDATGESSWFAGGYLDQLPDDVVIVHQVRHPEATVRSFHRIGLFDHRYSPNPLFDLRVWRGGLEGRPTPKNVARAAVHRARARKKAEFVRDQRRLVARTTDVFRRPEGPARYVRYWTQWNSLVERGAAGRPYLRIRLEDMGQQTWEELCDFLELGRMDLPELEPVNTKERYPQRKLDLGSGLGSFDPSVGEMAARYGYEI